MAALPGQSKADAQLQSIGLPSVTMDRLQEFRQRRLWHQCVRGASLCIAVCVGSMLTATLIDAAVDHAMTRWVGSLLVYSTTCLGIYWCCVRPFRAKDDLRNEAVLLEEIEPLLKDRLLSAVELSEGTARSGDSAEFTQHLQRQVATVIANLNLRQLLPVDRLRKPIICSMVCLSLLMGLCVLPGLRLPQRLAYALLPWLDLGRVSSVAIVIERPFPHSTLVPLDDLVAVTARIQGTSDSVWLESRLQSETLQTRMQQLPPSETEQASGTAARYQATLQATLPLIEYRVVAGGARTPWYRLTAAPRPAVEQFEMLIQPPAYADSEARRISGQSGNVEALAGSSVTLRLQLNQPVSEAELHWESANDSRVIKLDWNPRLQRYIAGLDISESGSYRVVLTSAETGFTNEFSPRYEVTAIPDLPPEVAWVQPAVKLMTAGANELLLLTARIDDELPVENIQQWLRVEHGDWVATPITLPGSDERLAGRQFNWRFDWQLDLQPLEAEAGQAVEVKIVATDRRGVTGESELVRILISSVSIDLRPDPQELARLELARSLEQLAQQVHEVSQELTRPTAEQNQRDSLSMNQIHAVSQSLAKQLEFKLPPILKTSRQALALTSSQVETKEVRLLSDHLSQSLTNGIRKLNEEPDLQLHADRGASEKYRRSMAELASKILSLADHARTLVTHDVARRHLEQIAHLAQAHRELSQASTSSTQQLIRRQFVFNEQLRQIQESMISSTENVQEASRKRWRESAERVGRLVDQMKGQMENSSTERLRDLIAANASTLNDARLMSRLDGKIYETLKRTYNWLDKNLTPAGELVHNVAVGIGKLGTRNPDVEQLVLECSQQLKDRREHARSSLLGDPTWASDLGLAQRSLPAVFEQGSDRRQVVAQLNDITQAVRTLNAAADLRVALALLNELVERERGDPTPAVEAWTESPRGWDSFARQLEQTVSASRLAKCPVEWIRRLERVQWSEASQQAQATITSRRWARDKFHSAASPVRVLMTQLRALQTDLWPSETEARDKLRSWSPSVAELARRAAAQTRDVSQSTASLEEQAQLEELSQLVPKLNWLSDQVQGLAPPMQQLRAALVDEADAQKLLEQQQIQRAARADAAIAMVDEIRQQTADSLSEIPIDLDGAQSEPAGELADALARAAEKQADAADALEEVANILESGNQTPEQSISENTLTELSAVERMQDSSVKYEQAERLAELAVSNPADVLQALENELPINVPMQQELSAIAGAAVSEAQNELGQAVESQSELTPAIQNSDPRLEALAKLLKHDLHAAQAQAAQLSNTLLKEATATAIAGRAMMTERDLREAQETLQQALDQLSSIDEDLSWGSLVDRASGFRQALTDVQQHAQSVGPMLARQQSVAIHDNGAALNHRRREMKDRQRRVFQQDVRNLQQVERGQQQKLRELEKEARQLTQQVKKEINQLEQLSKKLADQPDQLSLRQEIQTRKQQMSLLRKKVAANKSLVDEMQRRLQSATEAVQEANRRQVSQLESDNPSAELSAELTSMVDERSAKLIARLKTWASFADQRVQATYAELEAASDRQERIVDQVASSKETLARAARHERRLGNHSTSQQLESLVGDLDQKVDSALKQAQQRLRAAQEEDESSSSSPGQTSPSATASATAATDAAEEAISNSVEALSEFLNPTADKPQAAAQSSQVSPPVDVGQSNSAQAAVADSKLSAQELARLMDELDHRLNSPAAENSQSQPSLGVQDNNLVNPAAEESSKAAPETLAQAARKLAAQLSRTRESPSSLSNQDLGVATEAQAQAANVSPQPPVAVKVFDIGREAGAWGELRSQRAEGTSEAGDNQLAPKYRAQVEAYFKGLSLQPGGAGHED